MKIFSIFLTIGFGGLTVLAVFILRAIKQLVDRVEAKSEQLITEVRSYVQNVESRELLKATKGKSGWTNP